MILSPADFEALYAHITLSKNGTYRKSTVIGGIALRLSQMSYPGIDFSRFYLETRNFHMNPEGWQLQINIKDLSLTTNYGTFNLVPARRIYPKAVHLVWGKTHRDQLFGEMMDQIPRGNLEVMKRDLTSLKMFQGSVW